MYNLIDRRHPGVRSPLVALALACAWVGCSGSSVTGDSSSLARDAAPRLDAGASSTTTVLNDQYPPALAKLLDGAQHTIRLVHYYINEDSTGRDVIKRLEQAVKRGVKVYVMLESSVDKNPPKVAELKGLGIEAKLDSSGKTTHAKLVVVDGVRALLGSTNFSYSSHIKNNEANLLVRDAKIAGFFEQYAKQLWQDPFPTPSVAAVTSGTEQTLKDGLYPGHARQLIDGAKQRVMLLVYGLKVDSKYPDSDVYDLIKRMGKAVQRGVKVRVILEQADYTTGVNDVNKAAAKELAKYNIEVRRDPLSQISHAKVLIADDSAIVGSNNWGYGGFTLYHEVGVRTADAVVVKQLASYYEGIWGKGAKFD